MTLPTPIGSWRVVWFGTSGPYYYDDGADALDPRLLFDGVAAPLQTALITEGQVTIATAPSLDENVLRLADVGVLVGDVVGPGASTDHAVVRWDGVTGKLIQDSNTIINDAGDMYVVGKLGIGVAGPSFKLHLHDAANDIYQYIKTDKVNGKAAIIFKNDVQFWALGVDSDDKFTIASSGGLATDRLTIDTSGNATAVGMVRQGSTWHAYGGFEDQSETVACGVGDWNHITNGANTLWNLDESDGVSEAADVFTLTNAGDYWGTLSLSISASNGKDFHVRVYNNTQARVEGREIGISTTGAGNEMNVCLPIYIEGTAGDEIQFEIMSADGTDIVVDDGLFVFTYLHD